jgi:tagaturonate reductase
MPKKLNRETAEVQTQHPVRVLQFGEGNFLRAFADWMIDLLNEKISFQSSVQLVQPINNGLAEMINNQDGLYHVILEGLKEGKTFQETRLITCVKGCINPYSDFAKFLALAENPDLKFIISNTTEAGIAYDEKDSSLNTLPNSFPGKITALLYHRFKHFKGDATKTLIIIPCELIDQNGTKLKEIILQYCTL